MLWLKGMTFERIPNNFQNMFIKIKDDHKFFWNDSEWNIYENDKHSHHSTSLSGGNQVDGSPPARHTEAIGWTLGRLGAAPIRALDRQKLKIERNIHSTLPEHSVGVLDCIVRLLLRSTSGNDQWNGDFYPDASFHWRVDRRWVSKQNNNFS